MTEHGILFNGEMVRAILDNRKSQHRMKITQFNSTINGYDHTSKDGFAAGSGLERYNRVRPKWQVGDYLYVRENWYVNINFNKTKPSELGADTKIYYASDIEKDWEVQPNGAMLGDIRPSIHMPRWASRILLKITGIRHEKVGDITPENLIAEGLMPQDKYERGELYVDNYIRRLGAILFPKIDDIQTRLNQWIRAFDFEVVECPG